MTARFSCQPVYITWFKGARSHYNFIYLYILYDKPFFYFSMHMYTVSYRMPERVDYLLILLLIYNVSNK